MSVMQVGQESLQEIYFFADSAANCLESYGKWLGHAFKALNLMPQHFSEGFISDKTIGACGFVGSVGGVFADLPNLVSDVNEAGARIYAVAINVFSFDAWGSAACSLRSACSGLTHAAVDLGLGAVFPILEALDGYFTLGDGFDKLIGSGDSDWGLFFFKTVEAVSVLALGYFAIVGPVAPSYLLYTATVAAASSFAKDVWSS